MCLPGWFPFLRKKGYQPPVLHPSAVSTTSSTSIRRVDLLSRFAVIRNAYSRNAVDKAHETLEQDIKRSGTKENIAIYVDGVQAEEKEFTAMIAMIRRKAREKSTMQCERAVDKGELRIT
jgi:hypothetical protein